MYTYEERIRAVELYIKYDKSIAAVIRELGYPSRGMLNNWYREFEETGSLRDDSSLGYSKYTAQQRKEAVEYYISHGRSVSRTIKSLGFPKRTTLRDWINEDVPGDEKHCISGKTLVRCTQEQKEQAVISLCAGECTAKEIADDLGVAESSVNSWKRRLLSERCCAAVPNKDKPSINPAGSREDLIAEIDTLTDRVEELRSSIYRLQLEHDILEKADEILKKDRGINLETLTNREKATLIDALRDRYRLKELLTTMNMAKSSYCYQIQALNKPDKYAGLRTSVKEIFRETHSCYGYRRIHAVLRKDGICVSEKVVRRIMREEQISAVRVKKESTTLT